MLHGIKALLQLVRVSIARLWAARGVVAHLSPKLLNETPLPVHHIHQYITLRWQPTMAHVLTTSR